MFFAKCFQLLIPICVEDMGRKPYVVHNISSYQVVGLAGMMLKEEQSRS